MSVPKNMGNKIDVYSLYLEGLFTLSHLRQRIGLAWENTSSRELEVATNIDLLVLVIKDAKTTVEAWGGNLYFVYLPSRERYSDPSNAETFRDKVLLMAQRLGVRVVDIDTSFGAQADPLALFPFRRMGHYNEAGHKIVADSVLQQIVF